METSLPQTPGEYIEVFKKRKRLFLIPFFLTAATIGGIFPLIPKVYRASALVMISDEELIPSHNNRGRRGGVDVDKKLRSVYVEMMEPDTMLQLADMMGKGEKYRDDERRLRKWVGKFRRQMEITAQPGGVVEIAYADGDPAYAQKSANAVAELMVFVDRKAQQQESEKQIRFLEQQLRIYKSRINEGQKSFVSSRVSGNLEELMRRRSAILDQIDQFEKNTPAINRDQSPTVYKLQTELADTRSRLNQMALSARDDSPMIRDLRKRIAELENAISREKESAGDSMPSTPGNPGYSQALRQLRDVNSEIAFLRKRQANLEQGSAYISEEEVSAKSREQNVNEDIYQNLLQNLETAQMQLRLATFGEGSTVRVLEEAEKPILPVWPLPWQAIGFGLFLSLGAGAASVLIREMTDTSLRGVEDAQRAFKQPILATIPDLYPVKSNLESRSAEVSPQMVTLHNPQSLAAEHYRLLRTRILFVTQKRPVQVLMFSSAVAGEGKTTTSCNMAISMANELDKKIALIDCDLRQSAVGRYLGLPDKKGVHEYLQDEAPLDAILKPTRLERLSVITGGDPVANPSKLLASPRLGDLLRELRERFDYIIVDAAPVVPLADVPLLLGHVDAIALVAQVGKTPKKFVRQAVTSIENAQRAPLLGLVLTRAENTLPTYVNQYFVSGTGRRPRT
jgi:polysaccharide biosynthesis transport protein